MEQPAFIVAVYGILVAQLLLTLGVMYWLRQRKTALNTVLHIVYLVLYAALALVLALVPMPLALKFTLFTALSLVLGALLHQISGDLATAVVNFVLLGTIALFVAMSLVGLALAAMGVELSWLLKYIVYGSLATLVAMVGLLIWSSTLKTPEEKARFTAVFKVVVVISMILTSMYIVWATDAIATTGLGDTLSDAADAAIGLYLSFIDLLISLFVLQEP